MLPLLFTIFTSFTARADTSTDLADAEKCWNGVGNKAWQSVKRLGLRGDADDVPKEVSRQYMVGSSNDEISFLTNSPDGFAVYVADGEATYVCPLMFERGTAYSRVEVSFAHKEKDLRIRRAGLIERQPCHPGKPDDFSPKLKKFMEQAIGKAAKDAVVGADVGRNATPDYVAALSTCDKTETFQVAADQQIQKLNPKAAAVLINAHAQAVPEKPK